MKDPGTLNQRLPRLSRSSYSLLIHRIVFEVRQV